jgi:hypothetical protein
MKLQMTSNDGSVVVTSDWISLHGHGIVCYFKQNQFKYRFPDCLNFSAGISSYEDFYFCIEL